MSETLQSPFTEEELKNLTEVEYELDEINKELESLKLPEWDSLGIPQISMDDLKAQIIEMINEIVPEPLRTKEFTTKVKTDIVDFNVDSLIALTENYSAPMSEKDCVSFSMEELKIDVETTERLKNLVVAFFPKEDEAAIKYIESLNNGIERNKLEIERLSTIHSQFTVATQV